MSFFDALRREWRQLSIYEQFEQLVARALLLIISLIIVYTLLLSCADLWSSLQAGMGFLGADALRDTFGSFLTVLILLEFNHSIALSVRTHTGIVQVRVVLLIAIMVIARKLILLDYQSVSLNTLLGLGAVALSIGGLYWLLADGDRRRHPGAASPDEIDRTPPL